MTDTKALAKVTATEVAQRITAHFRRWVRDGKTSSDPYQTDTVTMSDSAHAFVAGGRIGVRYISYHDPSYLTKDEARHYLSRLNEGYVGRHYELFREHPVPEQETPEIRFKALIRDSRDKYILYGVTKRTKARVYGIKLAGSPYTYSKAFVPRTQVIRSNATEEDLEEALDAVRELHAAEKEARARYQERINALRTPEED